MENPFAMAALHRSERLQAIYGNPEQMDEVGLYHGLQGTALAAVRAVYPLQGKGPRFSCSGPEEKDHGLGLGGCCKSMKVRRLPHVF